MRQFGVIIGLGLLALSAGADDWPQWRGPLRDGVWRETGIVEKFDHSQLEIVWRVDVGGGYSGPTVADGRVYMTDRLTKPKQVERVHCFDAKTGSKVWTHEYACKYRDVSYETGPRASVTLDEGRAYSLGTMGHLFCFDAATGDVLWKKDLKKKYKINMPIWGIAAAPLIEGDLVIVQIGGKKACLVALDKKTGKKKWKALKDQASYSAPIVIEQAGQRVLVCLTGERVVGLDPTSGKLLWEEPFAPTRMIISIASPVLYEDYLYVTNFFDGSMVLKLSQDTLAVRKLWHRLGKSETDTDSLHSIISTPYINDGYIYGVDSYGEFRCLDLNTGDRVWESLDLMPKARWATAHLIPNGDKVWLFTEKGELIISKLSPQGFQEISRAKLIEPTMGQLPRRGGVCWTHPAFADKHIFVRNDKELVCASLAAR
ncbi:MAG: PQQ-like beta-propeller repeat protein [Planctomycetes bacterium]|nr:PQQ-like beta-propeller repeat protein [Planctomycetota bacterium]